MTNFIGRKRQIGIGKESTAGTAVAAAAWIPLTKPGFKPVSEKATDDSAYGNIDEIAEMLTTKNMTEISMEAILRDDWLGYLLLGAFGSESVTIKCSLASLSGSFTVGETVTQAVSGAIGVVKRYEGSPQNRLYIQVSTGTFTSGSNAITGGTSSASAVPTYDSGVRAHIFTRLNSNNHPSFTIYKVDDVDTMRAAYCMIDSLDLEVAVPDFSRFMLKAKGKQMGSTSATPAYVSANPWLAKHADLYFADTIIGLDAASAVAISRVKVTVNKNLTDYQALGDDDVASFHNRQFGIVGDFDAIFGSADIRDYMINSTKKAMRLVLLNDEVTIGNSSNPRLDIELARVSFQDWKDSEDNNALVTQTMGFTAEFDADAAYTGLAILVNDRTTAY